MSANTGFRTPAVCLLGLAVGLVSLTGCNRDPNVRKQKYLESGKRFEASGKYREAAIQFSNALKIDHNYADAHFELSKCYEKLGGIQAAYGELQKTVMLAPENVAAHLMLGQLSLVGGLPDKAQEQANLVLRANPNNSPAYALLAGVALRKGDIETSRQNMEKAVAISPADPEYHTNLGLIYSSDPATMSKAEPEFRKALELNSKSVPAHMGLAELLNRQGDLASAEQQFQAAAAADPKSIPAHAALAAFYISHQQPDKAEQTLKQLGHTLPDSQMAADMLLDFYTRTNQPGNAQNTFASIAADNPKSFVANYNYARVLVSQRQNDKASAVLDIMTKENAKAPETSLIRSALMMNKGQNKEALNTLKDATHNDAENLPLRMTLGRVAFLEGDSDTAMLAFQEAARIAPRSLEPLAGEADVANRRHDFALLQQLAEKALALNPNYEPALLWRATAHANQQMGPEAQKDLAAAVALNPLDARPHIEIAQILMASNKLPEASAELEKALVLDPHSLGALHQLLTIEVSQKQPHKAVERAKKQVAAEPNDEPFYRELSSLQIFIRDFNGARDTAQKALSLSPSDALAAQNLSQAYVSLGQPDAAVTLWQHWVTQHPNDAVATSMLAQTYEGKEDVQNAETWYQKSLELDPHQFWAANNLAYLLVEHNGNLDKALDLAQQARAGRSEDPNTADTLGWVYYHKGMYPSARELFENALKTAPDNAAIQYHLGMTYSKLGDRPNAVVHLKKALALGQNTKVGTQAQQALSSQS